MERGRRSAPGAHSTTRPTAPGSARSRASSSRTSASSSAFPNDFTRDWIEGHFRGLIGAAIRDVTGEERPIELRVADILPSPMPSSLGDEVGEALVVAPVVIERIPGRPGERRLQREVHLRLLRDRLVEPLRPRGRARRRRSAGAGVQPALHLRRHRPRQDASPPGRRAVRERAHLRAHRPLRHERDLHERLHQLAPRQADRGLQAALPHLRRADDRRRPVLRAQGADPGGVLPHVQLALRGRLADRHVERPAAARHRDARGTAAQPLRVGPDHGHPAARPRDAHRDPAQEGEDGRDPRPRPAGADVHRRAASRRTSASSKVRSPASSRSRRSRAARCRSSSPRTC